MLLLAGALWWAAAAANSPADVRMALIERINDVRKAHGKKPLVANAILTSVADARASHGSDPPPDPDVTMPLHRDAALRSGEVPLHRAVALRRAGGTRWREVAPAEVWSAPYDFLLYRARGVLFGFIEGPAG